MIKIKFRSKIYYGKFSLGNFNKINEKQNYIIQKYLKDFEKNSDFKEEFGINDNLISLRKISEEKEKKMKKVFNVLYIVLATIGISSFFSLLFNRNSNTKILEFYYTHVYTFKSLYLHIFNNDEKQISLIREYFKKMNENNINNIYFDLSLLKELVFITEKMESLRKFTNIKNDDAIKQINEIFINLFDKINKDIKNTSSKVIGSFLISLSKIINFMNKNNNFDKNHYKIAEFILNSSNSNKYIKFDIIYYLKRGSTEIQEFSKLIVYDFLNNNNNKIEDKKSFEFSEKEYDKILINKII